jgi:hypothetical protein
MPAQEMHRAAVHLPTAGRQMATKSHFQKSGLVSKNG